MSDNLTDINRHATDSVSDSAETPPILAQVGLRRAHKMSNTNEHRRLLRSKPADKDDELFVKVPKFSKRLRGNTIVEVQKPDGDDSIKELVPLHQKLYKFLKQANCQQWIWCEFIESYIDKAILASIYNMDNYVQTFYSQLETRNLPLRSWQIIRRTMGKARRFSPAFIAGERIELNRCRHLVRQLQQRNISKEQDGPDLQLMPKMIPLPLPVDTKVISLLSAPLLRLCKGRVLSYEPRDSSYMVKFNIAGKLTVISMPDSQLHALHEVQTMPLANIIQESRQKRLVATEIPAHCEESKPLIDALLQLQKLLPLKRKTVQDMAAMNEELELNGLPAPARRDARQTPVREKLQRRYAANMITLHRVNADLLEPLRVANNYIHEYEKDVLQSKCMPRHKLYAKCRTLAEIDLKATQRQSHVLAKDTRELILCLQTLLYLCVELGHGNNIEVGAAMDDAVGNMMLTMPQQLNGEFAQVLRLLQPLREHIQIRTNTEVERCQEQSSETAEFNFEMGS